MREGKRGKCSTLYNLRLVTGGVHTSYNLRLVTGAVAGGGCCREWEEEDEVDDTADMKSFMRWSGTLYWAFGRTTAMLSTRYRAFLVPKKCEI